jgi:hypothetical protein
VPAPGKTAGFLDSTPSFGLRAGLYGRTTLENQHFQYAVRPGAVVGDSVDVLNLSDQTHTFRLYGADLVQASDGGLAPTFPDDRQRDAGAWISMDSAAVTVPPHGQATVGFTTRVPEDAAPGDHLGAVVASSKTEQKPGALAVESRVALMVRVRIPGVARLDGTVGRLRISGGGGASRFTVVVHNSGNLLMTAAGRIEAKRGTATVAVVPVAPKDIYVIPGGSASFEGVWLATPMFGRRTATAVFDLSAFREPDITRRSDTVSLSFFSWLLLVLLGIVIAGLAVALVARGRGRTIRAPRAAMPVPVPVSREGTVHPSDEEWYS